MERCPRAPSATIVPREPERRGVAAAVTRPALARGDLPRASGVRWPFSSSKPRQDCGAFDDETVSVRAWRIAHARDPPPTPRIPTPPRAFRHRIGSRAWRTPPISPSWASSTSRPTRSPTAAVPRSRRGGRARRASWPPTGRRSSTSAGSRPGPAPSRSRRRRSSAGSFPVSWRLAAGGRAPRSPSTPRSRGRRAPRSTPARRYVNDVTASAPTPEWPALVGRARRRPAASCTCCGEPRTMQDDPRYDDVVAEVKAFLEERLAFAVAGGGPGGARSTSTRASGSARRRAQPRADPPPRRDRRARPPGRARGLAQVVPRPPDGPGRRRSARPPRRGERARAASAAPDLPRPRGRAAPGTR